MDAHEDAEMDPREAGRDGPTPLPPGGSGAPAGDLVTRLGAVAADPARRLRDAAEPLAVHAIGSADVRVALAALGLQHFPGYVWSRAACLGQPVAGFVVAAFAVFEPGFLRAAYRTARATCARGTLLRVREEATVRSLDAVLGAEQVDDAISLLRRALSAAPWAGRPLFAGLAGMSWPRDSLGQLWRACELLREHRGDTHVASWVSRGLGPVEMNVLTELWLGMPLGRYTRALGWGDQAVAAAVEHLERRGLVEAAALSEDGRALRCAIEEATNRGQRPIVDALGADLEPLVAALAVWSAQCVEAGTAPADDGKRAAG